GGMAADPRDEVRIAAVSALGKRCGPRAKGYLFAAFIRSGPAVRAAVGQALPGCGASLGDALAHWETRRRERAAKLLESQSAAQDAAAGGDDAAAVAAVAALLSARGDAEDLCAGASSWRNAEASRLLAAVGRCPASPFVAALKAAGSDDKRAAAAIAALLEL